MRMIVYYIIRPANALQERLLECTPEVASLFTDPTMYFRGETDRTIWTHADYFEQLKLLFLVDLASDYDGTDDPELRAVLDRLLGSPPWTADTFDKWWQLERIPDYDDIEGVQKTLKVKFLLRLESKSKVVIDWINRTIQAANSQSQ